MTDDSPLQNILNQLSDLYQTILSNQNKNLTIDPETLESIRLLSKVIDDISQHTEEEALKLGVTPDMIKNTILGPKTHLPKNLQNILQKSQHLKSQLEGCRNTLKDIKKKHTEESKGQIGRKKRKDRFKKLGGKEGWIPL